MKREVFQLLIASALAFVLIACGSRDETIPLNLTIDPSSPTRVYVPCDISDAHRELLKMLPSKEVNRMKNGPEQAMSEYHMTLGMWMRNNWGLWAGSRLQKNLSSLGFTHADDMSGAILKTFWRYLNNQPLAIEQEVKKYQEYWKRYDQTANTADKPKP